MPELPEVEIIRRRLRDGTKAEKKLVGRRVTGVHVPSPRALKEPSKAAFAKAIHGARFIDVKRRAKYLLVETDKGTLLVHLRLTGDLHVVPASAEEPRFLRLAVDLDDGSRLAFTDGRHLGEVRFVDDAAAHMPELGPEPLEDAFTVDVLADALRSSRTVKGVLMDQAVVAGVGNIYSDEACWYAKIHPARKAQSLDHAEAQRLHDAVRRALQKSMDDLVAADLAIDWRYADRSAVSPFMVYDRAGEPCPRCKTELDKATVAGRTSVFCPHCQKK